MTTKTQPSPPNREGHSVPGGGDNDKPINANSKNTQPFHPPETAPPSKSQASRPFHPPQTVPPSQSQTQQTISNHSTFHRQFHPPNPDPGFVLLLPPSHPSGMTQPSPPNPEGNFAPGGSFCQTPPAVLINPLTIPPSTDSSTLPIRAKPPKSSPPHRTRRVIRLLEGDFTPGGSFCCQRVITSGRQTQPAKTHANTTLPRQNPPLRTVPPSKSRTQQTNPDSFTLPIQNHPPNSAIKPK